jgi:HNH endonuclease
LSLTCRRSEVGHDGLQGAVAWAGAQQDQRLRCRRRHVTRLTALLRESLWLADSRTCHYCREPLELADSTFDHIVPRSFDGPTVRWNLVISCEACNNELADAVRKCQCTKCKRALNRFHLNKSRRPVIQVKQSRGALPRTVPQLQERIFERRENLRHRLNALDDQHTMEAAAMGGKLRAFTEVLDLFDGIDSDLWHESMVEALGMKGVTRAHEIYRDRQKQ